MKKIIIVLFFVVMLLLFNKERNANLIPRESLRFRIIANSNSEIDQQTKLMIRNEIEPEIMNKMKNASCLNEAKNNLSNYLPALNSTLDKYNIAYKVNLGNNYFPQKEYKGVIYPEGNYESLVITLGDGLGDNWWCVLFPPLCLLEAEENSMDNVEYQLFIKNIIDKL